MVTTYFSIHLPWWNRIFHSFPCWYLFPYQPLHFLEEGEDFPTGPFVCNFQTSQLSPSQVLPSSACSSFSMFQPLTFPNPLSRSFLPKTPHKYSAFEPTNPGRMMSWHWRRRMWWWWLSKAAMVRGHSTEQAGPWRWGTIGGYTRFLGLLSQSTTNWVA